VHRFSATAHGARLQLALASEGTWPLHYKQIRVVLPEGETRKIDLSPSSSPVSLST
jgi:hypothetical protein